MADLRAVQSVSAVSLSAAAAQTLIQLLAPTNQRVKLCEIGISFNGTVNTAVPVLVQLMLQTTAGTRTTGSPITEDGDDAETIQTVTGITFTVEPTYSSILRQWYVHPQTGAVLPLPIQRPITVKGAQRIALVANAPAAVSGSAYIEFEE